MRFKTNVLALSVSFAILAGPATAQATDDASWWNGGWGHMASGGIMMMFVWGGLIVLAIILIRYFLRESDQRAAGQQRQTPIEILEERFARGEVDQQEYEARRRVLGDNRR